MAWTITEPVSGETITIYPVSGDITIEEEYVTAVTYPLRGGVPSVTETTRRKATPTLTELWFRTKHQVNELRAIRDMSRRVELTAPDGRVFPVKFVGPVKQRISDAPESPIYVTVGFVGVN